MLKIDFWASAVVGKLKSWKYLKYLSRLILSSSRITFFFVFSWFWYVFFTVLFEHRNDNSFDLFSDWVHKFQVNEITYWAWYVSQAEKKVVILISVNFGLLFHLERWWYVLVQHIYIILIWCLCCRLLFCCVLFSSLVYLAFRIILWSNCEWDKLKILLSFSSFVVLTSGFITNSTHAKFIKLRHKFIFITVIRFLHIFFKLVYF